MLLNFKHGRIERVIFEANVGADLHKCVREAAAFAIIEDLYVVLKHNSLFYNLNPMTLLKDVKPDE